MFLSGGLRLKLSILKPVIYALFYFSVCFLPSLSCVAEQIAIANSSFEINSKKLKKVLLGQSYNARLFFLKDINQKNLFTRRYAGKSASSINRKWQRLVFSGRVKPPVIVATVDEMIQSVANNPNAIGHIDTLNYQNQQGIKIIQLQPR
jgi:hypothetical protein